MAVYDHEEQEQLDTLKTWWKMYGNTVISAVTAVALAWAGWNGWNWHQRQQSAEASNVYGALQRAAGQHDMKRVRDIAGELMDKYSATAYAPYGALLAAKLHVDAGDLKTARLQLSWVVEKAADAEIRDLARLRLASLMLDDKAYDEALKQLASEPAVSFQARFADLKGDVLAAQGKGADARAAYEQALAKLDAASKASESAARESVLREIIKVKLDTLAGSDAKVAAAAGAAK